MSKTVFLADQNTQRLPLGINPGSRSAHRLSGMINEHFQKRAKGTVLKLEGEETSSVYLVLSGWLSVSKSTMDGHRQIVDLILPCGILEPASADVAISSVEIEALTDVSFAAIPREVWLRTMGTNPDLGNMVHREIGAAFARMSERMLHLGKGDAESIIAFAFCELYLRSTRKDLREVGEFHIPLTQQQLGDLCGLSSVHICRTLRRLTRKGIVSVRDHMDVTIHDIDTLAEIAEVDLDGLRQEIMPRLQPSAEKSNGRLANADRGALHGIANQPG